MIPVTGENRRIAHPSEALEPACGQLEITLEWLQVHQIHDGDAGTGDYEAWRRSCFTSDDHLLELGPYPLQPW